MGNPVVNSVVKVGPLALKVVGVVADIGGEALSGDAKKIRGQAREQYENKRADAEKLVSETQQRIDDLNEYRQQQWDTTADRLSAWFKANKRKLKKSDLPEGVREPVEITVDELPDMGNGTGRRAAVAGVKVIAAGLTRVSVPKVLDATVAKVGKASTGTKINQLRGVAKEKATLAKLGGGPLVKGGGGITAGKRARAGLAEGGSAAVAGAFSVVFGAYDQTKAKRYALEADNYMQQIANDIAALESVTYYCEELRAVFDSVKDRALETLAELESLDFDPEAHAEKFRMVMSLMIGLREICSIQVVEVGTFRVSQELKDYIANQNESSYGTE
ncbi:hypothetical protein MHJ95_06085 [Corynebacterium imitans]|uniref:hypothetical protein n=1 Tax=Corynebacterium imitans TaxID=156978 RepID=UPI001EF2E0C5|nr:hypothetical protein [Corynebacterium imitans]MCG7278553.1 hypothetical protein [Corynebacterium imitans]